MSRFWENPVLRHSGRLVTRRWWPLGALALLILAGALGAALQQVWMELDLYSFLQPRLGTRWVALVLLAETAIALPWAAVRGALLWRRLRREGHLDEYRRSRLSAFQIAGGALAAALYPVLALLAASLFIGAVAGPMLGGLSLASVVTAHLLLLAQAAAFAAMGLSLAGLTRYPGLAIPLSLLVLAAAVGAIWAIDPFYRSMSDPSPWIYWALLPNPVTAVGNALETDVLRFSWVYERLHAHEYFFVYPPAWQTGGAYGAAAAVFLLDAARQVKREDGCGV